MCQESQWHCHQNYLEIKTEISASSVVHSPYALINMGICRVMKLVLHEVMTIFFALSI